MPNVSLKQLLRKSLVLVDNKVEVSTDFWDGPFDIVWERARGGGGRICKKKKEEHVARRKITKNIIGTLRKTVRKKNFSHFAAIIIIPLTPSTLTSIITDLLYLIKFRFITGIV